MCSWCSGLRTFKQARLRADRQGSSVSAGEESTSLQQHNPPQDTLAAMCPPCLTWTHNAVMFVLHAIQRTLCTNPVCVCVRACVRERVQGSYRSAQKASSGCVFVCWVQTSLKVFFDARHAPAVVSRRLRRLLTCSRQCSPLPCPLCGTEIPHSTVIFNSKALSSCGCFCFRSMSRSLPQRRWCFSSIRMHFLPSVHLLAWVKCSQMLCCLYFISLSLELDFNSVILNLLFSD